jgi:hypothetical protein
MFSSRYSRRNAAVLRPQVGLTSRNGLEPLDVVAVGRAATLVAALAPIRRGRPIGVATAAADGGEPAPYSSCRYEP